MSNKRALITGLSGMDGSHLADLLLEKDYEVYGLVRRSASSNLWRISHLLDRVHLIGGDLTDQSSLDNAVKESAPHEIYNLAAQSYVKYSFESPISTVEIDGLGVLKLLESYRRYAPEARFYQASTSEMFGKIQETPQKETTKFYPRSPYGCAKVMAHYQCVNYREAYKLHISCGILFNHESPRRGEEFVTRKITKGVAEYKKSRKKLCLGNLNASRDWGHARDYMDGAWRMLQKESGNDYVLATGETHTVKEWLEETCKVAGVDFWDCYTQNPTMERQSEVDYLKGDYSKANKELGWEPKIRFHDLVKEMYIADEERENGKTVS